MRPSVATLAFVFVCVVLVTAGRSKGGGGGSSYPKQPVSRSGYPKQPGSPNIGSSYPKQPVSGSSYPRQPGASNTGSSYPKQPGIPNSGSSYPRQPGSYGWRSAYGGGYARSGSNVWAGGAWSSRSYAHGYSTYRGASIHGNMVTAAQIGVVQRPFLISSPGYHRVNLYYVPYPRYYVYSPVYYHSPIYFYSVYDPVYYPVYYQRPIYYGLKCLFCDSDTDDDCSVDGATNKVVTCAPYQYCSVMRREITVKETKVGQEFCGATQSVTQQAKPDGEEQLKPCEPHNKTTRRVKVSRGCMSYNRENFLKADRPEGVKLTFQTCTTTTCNSGNGRLKCYTCQGNGTDSCVLEPDKVAKETFCPPYQNCHVLRREVKTASSTQVHVTRGCEAFDYLPEDSNFNDDKERLYAQSCSTDLCNIGLNYPTNWTIADYERVIEPSNSKESKNSSALQCYLCEGSDYDSCVLAKDDQIISCDEDEECNVMRKQTTLEDSNHVLVEVWRGCKPTNYTFDEPDNPAVLMFTQSCFTNLCNVGLDQGPNSGVAHVSIGAAGIFLLTATLTFLSPRD